MTEMLSVFLGREGVAYSVLRQFNRPVPQLVQLKAKEARQHRLLCWEGRMASHSVLF